MPEETKPEVQGETPTVPPAETPAPAENEAPPLITPATVATPNLVVVETTKEDVQARIENAAAGVASPEPPESAAPEIPPVTVEPAPEAPKEEEKTKDPLHRVFVYDGREFPDPDPKMTVEEVRQYYASFMPELSNASTSESTRPTKSDALVKEKVVTFTKRVGTKGCTLGHCTVKGSKYSGGLGSKKDIDAGICPVCKGPLEKRVIMWLPGQLANLMTAFQENVANGIRFQIVFDGKSALLGPIPGETPNGIRCGSAILKE